MPQTAKTGELAYRARIAKLQESMRRSLLQAVVLEPGAAMANLTEVHWGRSERAFALVVPLSGEPVWILPAFEEERAREVIPAGSDIRIWQEDESPYALTAAALKDRGIVSGRLGIENSVRFFIFDGIRKLAPHFHYVSAGTALQE